MSQKESASNKGKSGGRTPAQPSAKQTPVKAEAEPIAAPIVQHTFPLEKESVMHERFAFLYATLIGFNVRVTTTKKSSYEGIFHTASVEGDGGVVLRLAYKVEDSKDISVRKFINELIIKWEDIAFISARHIRSNNFHGHHSFQTDSEVTGRHGTIQERTLVPFFQESAYAGEISSSDNLDWNSSERSSSWDQYKVNAKFGVSSSYNEDIYTTSIDRNAPDYAEKEKRATQIAAEMENSFKSSHTANAVLRAERGVEVDAAIDEDYLYGSAQPLSAEQAAKEKASESNSAKQQQKPNTRRNSGKSKSDAEKSTIESPKEPSLTPVPVKAITVGDISSTVKQPAEKVEQPITPPAPSPEQTKPTSLPQKAAATATQAPRPAPENPPKKSFADIVKKTADANIAQPTATPASAQSGKTPSVQPTQTQTQPQVQPQTQPQVQTQAQPQVQPQTQPQVQPQAQPQVQPQAQPQVQPQPSANTTPAPAPQKPANSPTSANAPQKSTKTEQQPTKPSTVEAPVSASSSNIAASPSQAKPQSADPKKPKEAPKASPKETLKEATKEAPKESPKEATKEAPKESPKEATKEAPKETVKEAPKEPSKEIPKEPPKETPKETSKETLKEAPKEAPKEPRKDGKKTVQTQNPPQEKKEAPRRQESAPSASPSSTGGSQIFQAADAKPSTAESKSKQQTEASPTPITESKPSESVGTASGGSSKSEPHGNKVTTGEHTKAKEEKLDGSEGPSVSADGHRLADIPTSNPPVSAPGTVPATSSTVVTPATETKAAEKKDTAGETKAQESTASANDGAAPAESLLKTRTKLNPNAREYIPGYVANPGSNGGKNSKYRKPAPNGSYNPPIHGQPTYNQPDYTHHQQTYGAAPDVSSYAHYDPAYAAMPYQPSYMYSQVMYSHMDHAQAYQGYYPGPVHHAAYNPYQQDYDHSYRGQYTHPAGAYPQHGKGKGGYQRYNTHEHENNGDSYDGGHRPNGHPKEHNEHPPQ